ncbi:MAG: hypothetical protein WC635_13245 [Bacteriovorax sp.]|jgi:hypothetical protein
MAFLRSLLLLICFFSAQSFAAYELSFDFGYDRQIYGVDRQNSLVSRNYSAGISAYLFDLTAIDLNYSNTEDTNSQNDRYHITGTTFDVVAQQNRSQTDVYGIGIKQMLVGRGSRIVPVISAGYARQFVTSSGDITIENTTTSSRERVNVNETKQRYNSVFGSFTLQLKMTERFSLKGTVRTLFPAFEFNKAKDNLKYLVGFSWIF